MARTPQYDRRRYLSVAVLTAGISAFFILKSRSAGKDAAAGAMPQFWVGVGLLLLSLALDGWYGPRMESVKPKLKPTPLQLMLWTNFWSFVVLIIVCALQGDLVPSVAAIWRSSELLALFALFCLCSAAGQIFIYAVLHEYGSLVLSVVTTTRKFFTILVSVLLSGRALSVPEWTSVAVVFAGIALDIYFTKYARPAKKRGGDKKD